MKSRIALILSLIIFLAAVPVHAGWNPLKKERAEDQKSGDDEVDEAIAAFKNKDPEMKVFFDEAYGYAVFPTVGKGGFYVGGAYGTGKVYKQGAHIGDATLTQVTVGLQLGGQAYREIIFFKDKKALDRFTSGNFEFSARASAVAVTAGASTDADYSDGVAVFTLTKGGLMYEATIGGQKFSFDPK